MCLDKLLFYKCKLITCRDINIHTIATRDLVGEDHLGDGALDTALDCMTHRASAKLAVVAPMTDEVGDDLVGKVEADASFLFEALSAVLKLKDRDLCDFILTKGEEDEAFIDTVPELGSEVFLCDLFDLLGEFSLFVGACGLDESEKII